MAAPSPGLDTRRVTVDDSTGPPSRLRSRSRPSLAGRLVYRGTGSIRSTIHDHRLTVESGTPLVAVRARGTRRLTATDVLCRAHFQEGSRPAGSIERVEPSTPAGSRGIPRSRADAPGSAGESGVSAGIPNAGRSASGQVSDDDTREASSALPSCSARVSLEWQLWHNASSPSRSYGSSYPSR